MKTSFTILLTLCLNIILNAQWEPTNGPYAYSVYSLAVSGTNLFAGTLGGSVYRSTNNGTNWDSANVGLTNTSVYALATSPNGGGGTNIFAGTSGGVFRSTNNGASWSAAGLNGVKALATSPNGAGGTNLFAGAGARVYLSTDNGTSWSEAGDLFLTVQALATSPNGAGGTNIFAGTNGAGAWLSTNNGTSWSMVNTGLGSTAVLCLAISGTNIFAGTDGSGVYLSTNNGISWTAVNSGLPYSGGVDVYALATVGTNIFAGTQGHGVFLTTNNGTTWSAFNTGLTGWNVLSLATSGTYLFGGINAQAPENGVWRRPLSEITTVEENGEDIPLAFGLDQNYPNPFNPSTTIKYQLAQDSKVSLKIYDILGNEVLTLVNENQKQGKYAIEFDASRLASGVYFYKLQAGDFVESKKMIMLK